MSRRVAVVGAGLSGLVAAYELTRSSPARSGTAQVDLFEASDRVGGIIETVHSETAQNGAFLIECGPDAWVAEKPWARELAIELGLEHDLLPSNDSRRRTYLVQHAPGSPRLMPMPDGMRMMVPSQWGPLMESPLFTWQARLAYLREPKRAQELKASAPAHDESVASFVRRHFGDEVTGTLAAPLLAGVFGGDIETLSVRAVMPAFVRMEAEHGSLIHALQSKQRAKEQTEKQTREQTEAQARPAAIFTTLSGGLDTLTNALASRLPPGSIHLRRPVDTLQRTTEGWTLGSSGEHAARIFDAVILATPAHVTSALFHTLGQQGAHLTTLLPQQASSGIIVALAFAPEQAARLRVPRGFGFLAPPSDKPGAAPSLLACTFVEQKFLHRAPPGAVLLRAFFGGRSAEQLLHQPDAALTALAHSQLSRILGPLPAPATTLVRRWPLSLPQYAVGHLERIAELERLLASIPGLHVTGNAYHGVGLPDLTRHARSVAQAALAG